MNPGGDAELELIRDLMRKRRFGQALVASNSHEASRGASVEVTWLKATANFELGDFAEAERLLRSYLKLDPASAEALRRLAEVLRRLGRGNESIAMLESRLRQNAWSPLLAELAQNYLEAGNSDLAIMYAQRALEEDAESFQALMVLGCALVLLGAPEQGLKQLSAARELEPSDPQVYINMAAAWESLGNPQARIASLEKALLCEGSMLTVRKLLAELYAEAGDMHAAKSQWEAMAALGDDSFETRFGLALALRRIGEIHPAVELLLGLLREQSRNLAVWEQLAAAYVQLADYGRARRVLEQTLALDPQNSVALSLLKEIDTAG